MTNPTVPDNPESAAERVTLLRSRLAELEALTAEQALKKQIARLEAMLPKNAKEVVLNFLADCTGPGEGGTAATDLFQAWRLYASRTGEFVGTSRHFSGDLEACGVSKYRTQAGTRYDVVLKPTEFEIL